LAVLLITAFLDYHDIAYKVVEVNPMGKKELKWSEYKKVPVLVVDGEQMNDSTGMHKRLRYLNVV
jgi:microsomal prostaglandin-E synthase 2